eukprot:Opistho-2@62022
MPSLTGTLVLVLALLTLVRVSLCADTGACSIPDHDVNGEPTHQSTATASEDGVPSAEQDRVVSRDREDAHAILVAAFHTKPDLTECSRNDLDDKQEASRKAACIAACEANFTSSMQKAGLWAVGGGAAAGLAAFAIGPALAAIGFTTGGVAGGSIAAYVQSHFYGGYAAGIFSYVQGLGAVGGVTTLAKALYIAFGTFSGLASESMSFATFVVGERCEQECRCIA